ncbi:Rab family GTPase [Candidatus Borrarchaeum sp.]|uniref:Rab family GTPase n=1 Tax=Candidatus Borrarchaeum sp. TaxID=2846742 RepID=UPI0025804AAD|nr:Rab family GTPase [Candidatus Borrarchaeum sp.]
MHLLFKIVVVGDGAVGKTTLATHFVKGKFIEYYKMTIGVDFFVKDVQIGEDLIKLQIWDTAGQERFAFIRPTYYSGTSGGFMVFDVNRSESFKSLDKWLKEIHTNCGKIPLLLLGNKIDLDMRQVKKSQAEKYAKKNDLLYYETSAKTGEQVFDVFSELANILYTRYKVKVKDKSS